MHDVVWQQNASYSGEPTEENDKTWADLIPDGRGFVRHPVLAKELKAVSVFHQIHCLVRMFFVVSLYDIPRPRPGY